MCMSVCFETHDMKTDLGTSGPGLGTSVVPSRFCKSPTLLNALVAWTQLRKMRHNNVSREHHHILSTYTLHCMIAASSEAWHAIHCLITLWQYPPRLGILLCYILSCYSQLGSICQGLASYSICSGSICRALAFYSKSYHALAVSAKAWHSIPYLMMLWQYPPRLGIQVLFYILSRLGNICRGLASYSISYYALAVSAEA